MSTSAAAASLTAEIVNPVISATIDTFGMMLGCKATRKRLFLKTPETSYYPITAVIGLSGKASGSVCLSLSREAAFQTVKRILEIDVDEITGLVTDAVGEFANMIVGSAKGKISGLELEMGLPNIVTGERIQIEFPSCSQPICVEFDSEIGPFMICCGFISK
jgi:chemotaxis protein CheX